MNNLFSRVFMVFLLLAAGFARGAEPKISVVTTIFPPYDFARAVGGDRVELKMLLPPGAESHSFEPTPQDLIAIQKSDLFIYGGGESDTWIKSVLQSLDGKKFKALSMMEIVEPVAEETVEGMQAEAEEEVEYDEHVWTSPRNAKKIAQAISAALCELDAASADFYRERTAAYAAQLDQLDADFAEAVKNGKRKVLIFGDRFPFRYFVDAYGLKYFAAFPGCSTETEASAKTVAFLMRKVRDEKIPVVFYLEMSNQKMADTIVEATGAKKLLFHACHNIGKKEWLSGVTYLDLMRQNLKNLRAALE
ncbi:MAG: metal ABC transporter substrate-binding protein [Planctomycetota bacterium]|jgi:zinc transport system substrate-binding protein|nr:metal ABC transporter substrate-binding protein [Planctomycetota bacterium]